MKKVNNSVKNPRKTNEEFLQECKEKGVTNKIKVLTPYKGAREKITCQCLIHKNFKWESQAYNVLNNLTSCLFCQNNVESDTLASNMNELFLERLNKIGILDTVEILEFYRTLTKKVKCRCKIHDEIFYQTPQSLYTGKSQCFKCMIKNRKWFGTARTHEQFLEQCKYNNSLNKIEILGTYTNETNKIRCKCKIHNYIYEATPYYILFGNGGCPKCAKETNVKARTYSFEKFLQKFKENNENYNDIEILGPYINLNTSILCRCKKHNSTWITIPSILILGSGCPLCGDEKIGNKLRKPESQFDKELHELFPNIDRIEKYINDRTPIKFYCNDCKSIFSTTPTSLLTKKKGCSFCSDGLSFPNKVGRNLMFMLLGNNFDFEWMPEWIKSYKYRYDLHFFYNNKEYIIELDGGYHIKPRKSSNQHKNLTIEEVKNRDKFKTKQAEKQGITVIRIDCATNDLRKVMDRIKNNQQLNEIFDLSNFDWNLCFKKSMSSILKEVCLCYENNKNILTKEISKQFKLSNCTIQRYLREGTKIGLCNYPDGRERKR